MKTTTDNKLLALCSFLIALLLVLVPFHALLTVWAGSTFGHYALIRVWIEVVLICLAPIAVLALHKDKELYAVWRRNLLVVISVVYVGWQILLGIWARHEHWVNNTALLDGLTTDLRFIGFFLITWGVARRQPWLALWWKRLLLLPAALVTVFGVLQATILPKDVLRHVGYGPHTILPYETVNQNAHYVRAQSTLRGPNIFGAYLTVTIPALVILFFGKVRAQSRLLLSLALAISFVALGLSYSRAAYIGVVIAVVLVLWLSVRSQRARRLMLYGAIAGILLLVGAFVALRHNASFDNAIFHTTSSSHVVGSDQVRRSVFTQTLHDVLHQPLGRGAGSSGPASVHNNHPANIPEDYYLQVGQEAGWFGLLLFITITILTALELWKRRDQELGIVLLASFIGLACINVLSPAWADETIGILWWGLAGIGLSLPPQTVKNQKATKRRV